jgi:hypothetical protein
LELRAGVAATGVQVMAGVGVFWCFGRFVTGRRFQSYAEADSPRSQPLTGRQ